MLFIYLVFKVHLGDDILIGIQIRLNQSINQKSYNHQKK